VSLRRHLEDAFKALAPVAGQLAIALETKRVTRRQLLEQVEQLKFATKKMEEAIGAVR
jgi:hypothetical protein